MDMNKLKKEIKDWQQDIHDNEYDAEKFDFVFDRIYEIIEEQIEKQLNAYILVFTDGFRIQCDRFDSYEEAYAAMKKEYESYITTIEPAYLAEAMETSYFGDFNAELKTGYDLYLWSLVKANR